VPADGGVHFCHVVIQPSRRGSPLPRFISNVNPELVVKLSFSARPRSVVARVLWETTTKRVRADESGHLAQRDSESASQACDLLNAPLGLCKESWGGVIACRCCNATFLEGETHGGVERESLNDCSICRNNQEVRPRNDRCKRLVDGEELVMDSLAADVGCRGHVHTTIRTTRLRCGIVCTGVVPEVLDNFPERFGTCGVRRAVPRVLPSGDEAEDGSSHPGDISVRQVANRRRRGRWGWRRHERRQESR